MSTAMSWSQVKTRELTVSNHLIGDHEALEALWARDGYWFFRDVIDHAALQRLRAVYVNVLAGMGLVDPADPDARWTGAPLDQLPFRMDPLVHLQAWRGFVAEPSLHVLFKRLLNDEPFWVPTPEYRAYAPAQDRTRDRIDSLHQDGFYNVGIPYRVCWIPLSEIDEDVGGLTLAEGQHHGPFLHDMTSPPYYPIKTSIIPGDAWRRSNYRPGDLVMMHLNTPHSGLANYSDRFRLSLDIRVMPASGDIPFIGKVAGFDSRSITLSKENGLTAVFTLDEDTLCRGLDGLRLPLDQIPGFLQIGATLIVASEDGRALVVRPPH